jgi:Protein of unknown function (DUF2585)
MDFKRHFPLQIYLLIAAGFLAIQGAALILMGQPLTCACGTIKLWTGSVTGSDTSQQLTDWYTFTHINHGFAFYLLLWLLAPNSSIGFRLAFAVMIEAGWEIVENTPFIIDRYRQLALAQGYVGDSVLNSIGDTLAAIIGFGLAHILPRWSSILLVAANELLLAYVIRDTLALNIIQLIYPIDAIARWQTGG